MGFTEERWREADDKQPHTETHARDSGMDEKVTRCVCVCVCA